MSHTTRTQRRTWKERALSLLLAAAMIAGLVPGLTLPASAEHWADAYLDQLVDWGVIRADQTANPDADLTRAEFMAIVNRAYGYAEPGPIPFEDVLETDWFYDDISIAYTAGYMAGTSATTASPNDPLTREQAICILGRNMMMKDAPGESLAFADSRDVSDWARGTLKAAADSYIISGYPDNTIHPKDNISRGQMAALITQCVGNPIQASGVYDLGGVFGNVTITAPNVTLRNAVISGDLYISGGVGLGGIKLENVDVLGRIIVSSSGESEGGDASVIMRNVTAEEMLVDNMQGKTVTIRADGITKIANTVVRTDAYLEDNNTDEEGLMRIELDGNPGTRLTLAGRIKEVVDKTPSSYIQVAKGTVAKLTVDETATNSTVQLDRSTKVAEMNLDVATSVLGEGDIGKLNINAPGSVVTMLPDEIYIRPGLTASIAGVIMDYQAAAEGSLDPRLLSGYPAAKDIAPTGFRADFAANKKGTIYWAVSYVSDGSIGEDDLISPPSYGSKAITNGSLTAPAGGDEVSAQVGNLVVGGSYYLSALVVDEQNNRSPVKVISFSTPDNTVPAFAEGYPYMSRTTSSVAQVTVMPTKSCKLYYALLPKGAKAPTTNELKAAAVAGNLGYGMRDVTKNTEAVFTVNSQRLEELKEYVLYLWLTDVDGINSSAVTSLTFTIPDETPPEFVVHPYMNGNPEATSIPMSATVNENATIFWAVVEEGTPYPLPNNNSEPLSRDNEIVDGKVVSSKLTSDYAKLCVVSGMGALQRGQVVANANTEATFNITGLLAEKAYDFYYLARDTAGNYTVQVYKLEGGLHTLDQTGPYIVQSFSAVPSEDSPNNPLSSTDIYLDFSENVHSMDSSVSNKDFLKLYSEKDKTDEDLDMFVRTLQASIVLYHIDPNNREADPVVSWKGSRLEPTAPEGWVVDYSKVTVRAIEDGRIRVTFPGSRSNPNNYALNLANGEQYFFQFKNLADTSTANNLVARVNNDEFDYRVNRDERNVIPVFTTVFSQVLLDSQGVDDAPIWSGALGTESGRNPADADLPVGQAHAMADANFRLNPQSTANTADTNRYDILIFSDTTVSFDLYYRLTKRDGTPIADPLAEGYGKNLLVEQAEGATEYSADSGEPDGKGWFYLGNQRVNRNSGKSVGHDFTKRQNTTTGTAGYPKLQNMSEDVFYEFVISVTENGIQPDRKDWSGEVYFDIYVEAGRNPSLDYLGGDPAGNRERCESWGLSRTNGVANIGLDQVEGTKYLHIPALFSNTQPPYFREETPRFTSDGTGAVKSKYVTDDVVYNIDGDAYPASLVGDTFAYVFVNLNAQGTVHYVVSTRNLGYAPVLKRSLPQGADVWDYIPADGHQSMEPPEVIWPKVDEIAEHDEYFDERTYPQQGSIAYNSSGAIPITIDGLTANTDYYIYFVLEAKSANGASGERSGVYTYKFKTAQTTKPRITLRDDRGGTVAISTFFSEESTLNVSADLHWVVLPKYNGEGYLNKTFTGVGDKVGFNAGGAYAGVKSWLDALTTTYHANEAYGRDVSNETVPYGTEFDGLTVFDVFATNGDKQALEEFIRQTPHEYGVSKRGDAQTRPTNFSASAYWGDGQDVQSAPEEYIILVAGHNTGSRAGKDGEYAIDSFRVYSGVIIQDLTAPSLVSATGPIYFKNNNPETIYTNISLVFSKDVYWLANGVFYKVMGGSTYQNNGPQTGANNDDDNNPPIVGILHRISEDVGNLSTDGGPNDFRLTFDTVGYNTDVTLLGGGNIAAYRGQQRNLDRIRIRIGREERKETVTDAEGNTTTRKGYIAYYIVSFGNEGGEKVYAENVLWEEDFKTAAPAPAEPKPDAVAPTMTSITASNVTGTSTGSYSMTLGLTFDQALYTKSGNSVTAVSGSKLATTSTVDYDPVKAGAKMGTISSSGSGKSYTLRLTNVKPGTITLPSQTFYDKTGKASTTDEITIEIKEVKSSSNASKLAITAPQVTVSFGDFEQTKTLK